MAQTTIAVGPGDRFSETAQTIRSVLEAAWIQAGCGGRGCTGAYRALNRAGRAWPVLHSDDLNANAAKNWVVSEGEGW
jgi:hypothetical protein